MVVFRMTDRAPRKNPGVEASRALGLEMEHLQVIEGNPLTTDEIALFEMFEREGGSPERRREHILATIKRTEAPAAAE